MPNILIPTGDGAERRDDGAHQENASGDGPQQAPFQRRAKNTELPSEEACLRVMTQVAGLVAMGLLKPAQAQAIRASYRELLQYHKTKARANAASTNLDVMDLLRKSPEMLNLLEPLLTDEQIAKVMESAGSGADEQA
jgi:hypothetical protein